MPKLLVFNYSATKHNLKALDNFVENRDRCFFQFSQGYQCNTDSINGEKHRKGHKGYF